MTRIPPHKVAAAVVTIWDGSGCWRAARAGCCTNLQTGAKARAAGRGVLAAVPLCYGPALLTLNVPCENMVCQRHDRRHRTWSRSLMDPKLRAMLPLFAAVFIDLFSFG